MHLPLPLAGKPSVRGLRPLPLLNHGASRRSLRVQSVMGNYQYQHRAAQLRSRGVEVYEFGGRVLREGCFGEDVLQLQGWLAEEAYYNPVDGGYTGYFGSVTKEALQAWQRDAGVAATGHFDGATKWAYLRSVEESMRISNAQHVENQQYSTEFDATAMNSTGSVSISATPFFAAAALLAGVAVTCLVVSALHGTHVIRNIRSFLVKTVAIKSDAAVLKKMEKEEEEEEKSHHRHLFQQQQEEEEYAVFETVQQQQQETQSTRVRRRLSDEELQRYLAPFKGTNTKTKTNNVRLTTTTQRPVPRRSFATSSSRNPTTHAPTQAGSAPSVASRHGTYYGGRQVIERVKKYLADESAPGLSGPSMRRMQSLGYDMRTARSSSNSSNSSGTVERTEAAHRQQEDYNPITPTPTPTINSSNGASPSSTRSFEDLPAAGEYEFAPSSFTSFSSGSGVKETALLSGTELEMMPDSPLRPVHVQRGAASTVQQQQQQQQSATTATATAAVVVMDPNASVVVGNRPVKLHKPRRLAGGDE